MKRQRGTPGKDQIAREILSYLSDHPDAADTIDGIIQWWLLETKIEFQRKLVIDALERLVRGGLVSVEQRENAEKYYHAVAEKDWILQRMIKKDV